MLENVNKAFTRSSVGQWYAGREPNERVIIGWLVFAVVLTVLWAGVWKPLSDWRAVEDNRYQNAHSLLEWMQANESRARSAAKGQQGNRAQRSLLPTVTTAAQAEGLVLSRLQPESNGAVSVVLQGQEFNAVIRWLHRLQETNAVSVQRISLDADGRPGYVNAQLRLR
jgi:general secretion pathway protein M